MSTILYSALILIISSANLGSTEHRGPGVGGSSGWGQIAFFDNVPQEGIDAYFNITNNVNLTINEIDTQLTAWAATYNVSTAFSEFQSNATLLESEWEGNVTQLLSNLTTFFTDYKTIIDNKDLTIASQTDSIMNLTRSNEITAIIWAEVVAQLAPYGEDSEGRRNGEHQGGYGSGQGGYGGRQEGRNRNDY